MKAKILWVVYILRCKDGTYYTGITTDLNKRVKKHNSGKGAKYTRNRGPVKVVYAEGGFSKSQALKFEYKIKQLSRKEKEDLMNNSSCGMME